MPRPKDQDRDRIKTVIVSISDSTCKDEAHTNSFETEAINFQSLSSNHLAEVTLLNRFIIAL